MKKINKLGAKWQLPKWHREKNYADKMSKNQGLGPRLALLLLRFKSILSFSDKLSRWSVPDQKI